MDSRRGETDRALRPIALVEAAACLLGAVVLGALTARQDFPLIYELREMIARLLTIGFADTGLAILGLVAAFLLLGTGALWIVLILGFGSDGRGRAPN